MVARSGAAAVEALAAVAATVLVARLGGAALAAQSAEALVAVAGQEGRMEVAKRVELAEPVATDNLAGQTVEVKEGESAEVAVKAGCMVGRQED